MTATLLNYKQNDKYELELYQEADYYFVRFDHRTNTDSAFFFYRTYKSLKAAQGRFDKLARLHHVN